MLARFDVSSTIKVPHEALDELRQLIRRAEEEYCAAWESEVGDVPLEFRARAMASHLLDSGFSQSHLHRWLTAITDQIATISDLNRAVSEMFDAMPIESFEVFVPCAAPFSKNPKPESNVSWIDGAQGSAAGFVTTSPSAKRADTTAGS